MSVVTAQQIRLAAKAPVNESNMNSVLVAIDHFGATLGMDRRARLVQFFAQVMHESGEFRYDGEIWGPTPAQKRYDTRTDLGNTPAADGDGYLYRGRTAMQLTGKGNYAAFRDWSAVKGFEPPDFVKAPDLVNTDPWEGLVPLWYWETRKLNMFADKGDIETITKRINGGLNGFADRCDHFVRLGLVVLGFGPRDISGFQRAAKQYGSYTGAVDGAAGPKTWAALHAELVKADKAI
jgi:putative chitinase